MSAPLARAARPVDHAPVQSEVFIRHARDTEASGDACRNVASIERACGIDGIDRLFPAVHEEASAAMLDDFGHRAAPGGDDRGAAGHGLDDRKSKGFFEIYQVQQSLGLLQRGNARGSSHRAVVDHAFAIQMRQDFAFVIVTVLDDAINVQPPSRSPGAGNRLGGALVGVDAAEIEQVFVADRVAGKPFDRGGWWRPTAATDGGPRR
jgi:hypothetical protein